MIRISAGQVPLKVLTDSGASSNIDSATWEQLKKKRIKCCSKASSLGRSCVPMRQMFPCRWKVHLHAKLCVGGSQPWQRFWLSTAVAYHCWEETLSWTYESWRLEWTLPHVVSDKGKNQDMYPELFQDVGKRNTHQVKLHVNQSVEPVAQPLRRVPFNLCGKVEQKLDELLEADISQNQ